MHFRRKIRMSNNDGDEDFTADDREDRDATGRLRQKGGCYVCYTSNKKKRATRQACVTCKKPICVTHSVTINNVNFVIRTKG